jgi:hypothetical protein
MAIAIGIPLNMRFMEISTAIFRLNLWKFPHAEFPFLRLIGHEVLA